MGKRHQWHSARDGERVHHDHEDCPEGQNIDYYWLRHNGGGRPLCGRCAHLNAADRLMFLRLEPPTQVSTP